MITGSAPIDKQVIDFLKICFSCPIQEGYGLTESSASCCIMDDQDPVTGHVGGPIEVTKIRLKSLPEMEYNVTDEPYPRGELLMKSLTCFSGYFKCPEKTQDAFDEDDPQFHWITQAQDVWNTKKYETLQRPHRER